MAAGAESILADAAKASKSKATGDCKDPCKRRPAVVLGRGGGEGTGNGEGVAIVGTVDSVKKKGGKFSSTGITRSSRSS